MIPFPLRQQSLGQVIALKLATPEGKFEDLVNEMFRRQDQQWGMSMPELMATVTAVGMNGESMQALFEDDARLQPLLSQVIAEQKLVSDAFATPDGGISVPRVAINGRVVAPTTVSLSPACFAEFIDNAIAGE
jgi:hypothetical protein